MVRLLVVPGVLGPPAEERRVRTSEFQFWRAGSAVEGGFRPDRAGSGLWICRHTTAGPSQQQNQHEGESQDWTGPVCSRFF